MTPRLLSLLLRHYLEVQRLGPAREMLQPCLFFQGVDAQRRTARPLPEGEVFKHQRRQSALLLGRQLRKRGHGLPQQFSHSPILALTTQKRSPGPTSEALQKPREKGPEGRNRRDLKALAGAVDVHDMRSE